LSATHQGQPTVVYSAANGGISLRKNGQSVLRRDTSNLTDLHMGLYIGL